MGCGAPPKPRKDIEVGVLRFGERKLCVRSDGDGSTGRGSSGMFAVIQPGSGRGSLDVLNCLSIRISKIEVPVVACGGLSCLAG